jgi:TolB protein
MKRENLVKWLGKKVLPYFLAGSLAFSTLFNYRCANEFVEPEPEKPVAMFIAQPTEGDVPLEVSFDAGLSYPRTPGAKIETYILDANGDGDPDIISDRPNMDFTYEDAGIYEASLKVTDSNNQTSNNKALEKIVVNEDIVTLGSIAFWSNRDVPEGGNNEEIYSGDIVLRVKDNNIELRNIERLTTDPGQDLEPAWSPDGKEILFTSHRNRGTAVWRMNADGSNQRDITSDIVESSRNADWGSNGNIVVSYRDSGFAGIGIINPDENSFIPIYPALEGNRSGWPKYSPDCSEIVFQKYINGNWEIYMMNSDGTNLRNLTNHHAIDNQPVFLPDKRILFWSDRAIPNQVPIEADLYLMDSDGSNVTRLTDGFGGELDPEISSDGKYLLFTRMRFFLDPPQLYLTELINAEDTTKWIQLTTEKGAYPAWRPKKED